MNFNKSLPHYVGGVHPNCDYHHGQIFPAKGVKLHQVSRANRNKELDDNTGFTYKHAPDMAYWNGRFYIQYLCNPKDEHTDESVNILVSSKDGVEWSDHRISFPAYKIPPCEITDYKGETHLFDGTAYAFIHHRMCFYKSSDDRMLLLSFYGWSPKPWLCNWDNYGIGRVVRELRKDGTLGDIYFIRPCWQGGWSRELLNYPLYSESPDKGFIKACEELLSDRLYTQQWAEENGDNDEIITVKHPKKGVKNEAFCWYHIDNGDVIGLWKHSRGARSSDGGKTWSEVERCPSLVMSGQKVWAQKTSDGNYAMVYDPTMETQHRYPMCVTTSKDGLSFDNMLLVHGEVPPMKYEGFWKDMGPQYMRGICEGFDIPPDGKMWVTYSVNKEDIWAAEIPVPITGGECGDVDDRFSDTDSYGNWNTYSPLWAKVTLTDNGDCKYMRLADSEPYDYCKAERAVKESECIRLEFSITPRQNRHGNLYIEACDEKGIVAVRLVFRDDGKLAARTVAELPVYEYKADCEYNISLEADCQTHLYTISINGELQIDADGEPIYWKFMSAVNTISRVIFRTGAVRHAPTLDDIPDGKPEVPLYKCEAPCEEAVYDMAYFRAFGL